MEDQKKIIATTSSAVGISTIASFIGLCCIGPWSVALLGVSGAITMARYAYLRPYILVVAAIMLGWAFWRVYFKLRDCDDNGCETRTSYWLQAALWIAAVMVILAFFAEELQWILVDPTPVHLRNPD